MTTKQKLREAAQNALVTLDGIANANPRDTSDFETPACWIEWAKSRARWAADALRSPIAQEVYAERILKKMLTEQEAALSLPTQAEPVEGGEVVTVSQRTHFTYKNQPFDNVTAWRFGEAARNAKPGGDLIDHGLSLLQELEKHGYGIFALATPPASQEQAEPAAQEPNLHLFEFWWSEFMPGANQAEAWAAWTSALSANGACIERLQPAAQEPVRGCIACALRDATIGKSPDQSVTAEYIEWLKTESRSAGVAGNEAWNAGVAWARANPPPAPANAGELPPLPKPDDLGDRWLSSHVYTADQMRAYARAALQSGADAVDAERYRWLCGFSTVDCPELSWSRRAGLPKEKLDAVLDAAIRARGAA